MYAGNVGFSQSLELLVDAAHVLAGTARRRVRDQRRRIGPSRPRAPGGGPRQRAVRRLPAPDGWRRPGRRRHPRGAAAAGPGRSSVPSKAYSILAAGRPVVASVDEGTEVARVVEKAGAGIAVPPDDPEAFSAPLTGCSMTPPAPGRWVPPGGRSSSAGRRRRSSPAATRRCSTSSRARRGPPGPVPRRGVPRGSLERSWVRHPPPRRSPGRPAPEAAVLRRPPAQPPVPGGDRRHRAARIGAGLVRRRRAQARQPTSRRSSAITGTPPTASTSAASGSPTSPSSRPRPASTPTATA